MASSVALNAQTQIGNPGFEDWESVDGGTEPTNWNGFLTADGSLTTFSENQMAVSTDVRPGSAGTKSVRIWSRSVIGIVANGNMTLGRIRMGSTSPSSSSNYNRSVVSDANYSEAITDKPDSIVFWVKFKPNGHNQNARMSAIIHNNNDYRDPEDAGSAAYVVGKASVNFPSTSNQWVRKSIPFSYSGPSTDARYLLLTFTTNETPGGGASNDEIWIDDVELIYVPKPTFTTSSSTVCAGSTINFTNTSTQFPTTYSWSFPGGSPSTSTAANPSVMYATAGTYDVTLTATNQWGSKTVTFTNHIAVNQVPNPAFNYSASSFCTNVSNPTPSSLAAGNFTVSSPGLVFANASTGEINLSASSVGTYTITKATLGACSTTATATVNIFQGADASFSYPTNTICSLGGDQTPTVTETGGTFSSTPTGLVFANAATGVIDVANSTNGTYTISHIRAGACPDTFLTVVTLTDTPVATFNYSKSAFCANESNPQPVFTTGANAGVFSSTSGLSINSNTGIIDLSTSTSGAYVVTNDIAAIGVCPSATHTFNIQINALPSVNLTITNPIVCSNSNPFQLSGGTPAGGTYTGAGVLFNIFNPATVSQGDVSVITYTYTDGATNCINTATGLITVDACLSIEDLDAKDAVVVFPNPTKDILTIENAKNGTIYTIISLAGQIIEKGELNTNSHKIDLSTVQNGLYLLQLQHGENLETIRVVKQ